ncbi:MAG: gliding motility-associated C-terminal domain-containing protein, partial [Prevotellaceae bacterium]|nr:gliding motility-associated C-terminal domain-containing protein [Prevotellaceae bacterium]
HAGRYAVEVTNTWGCMSERRGEATLDVNGLPVVYFTANRACENKTEFSDVEPSGGTFTGWGTKNGEFIPSEVRQGTAVVTYTYTAPNGCVNSATANIEIIRLPNTPTITANGLSNNLVEVCQGDISVPLKTNVAVGSDTTYSVSYTYQWYMDGFKIPDGVAQDYVATKKGSYAVRVCNQGLCWAENPSIPVTVSQLPPPVPPVIAASSFTFCPGDLVELFVQSEDRGFFQWYKGNGKKMDEVQGEIADTYFTGEAGQYAMDYIDGYGCRSAFSNALTITEHPMPKQPEVVPSQANLYSGLDYKLLVKYPEAGDQYEWYKNTLYADVTDAAFPIKNLSDIDTGSYTVKASNQQGCFVWSEAYPLRLSRSDLFIPNIFTPNGDGINDYFQILGLDDYVENKLVMLNKRGQVIFSQKNYHNTWSGKGFSNDIYYYTLTLKRADGTSRTLYGYVHKKQ